MKVGFILAAIFWALMVGSVQASADQPEWFVCSSDKDCVETQGVCFNPRAVKRDYLDVYKAAVAEEQAQVKCAPVINPPQVTFVPRCINQKCEMSGSK